MPTLKFVLPIAGLVLMPLASSPAQARSLRPLASFTEQFASGPKPSPDGRFLLLGTRTELRLYEVASRRTTKLVDGLVGELAWSSKGDRIAWVRANEEDAGEFVWTMALDPRTGRPAGPPQRVSMAHGEFPSISVDGKWIAYSAPDTDAPGSTNGLLPHHIVIVPVTGGPERSVGHFAGGMEAITWSADGKALYLQAAPPNGGLGVIKVPVDGRPMQTLWTGPQFMVGMTENRQRIILVPAKGIAGPGDHAIMIDTAGKEVGRAPLPVGRRISYNGIIGDTSVVWIDTDNRQRIEVRSLAGGAPQRPTPVGNSNELPAWSPDGKHIAFHVRDQERRGVVVVDVIKGKLGAPREIHTANDMTLGAIRWSPDSKYVGFSSNDGHQLSVIDLATRRRQTVAQDTTARINMWTWRPDARSIVAVMVKEAERRKGSIDELSLSGTRRMLFDFGKLDLGPTSGFAGFTFIGDSAVAYRTDTSAYVLSLRAGAAPRRIATIPRATIVVTEALSRDGRWMAGPFSDMKHHDGDQLEMVSFAGERRVLETAFRFVGAGWPAFTADNSAILIFGRRGADTSTAVLYSVPVNGDPPRGLATTDRLPGNAPMSISPDGKSVAYAVMESHTLNLSLIDLRSR